MSARPTLEQARQLLRQRFGYQDFRLQQAEIIQALLAGEDVLALMPTGGGKSLCYQIPALLLPGTAVVVSPLIALMEDQVTALEQLGVRAALLNSSQEPEARRESLRRLRAGELDLLYLAPERLLGGQMLEELTGVRLALFAIDEAHCVSQWGHDFRPEYRRLSVLQERFPQVPRIALTATADARTRGEIIQQLGLEQARVCVNSFDRPNIRYHISEGSGARERLWRFIEREHPQDAGIVYCLSRRKVDEVALWLNRRGRAALPYHAGMSDAERKANQTRFIREEGLIMVATIAFGMGIDKPDVRFVAHLNLPRSIEAYYQETGRAGRDGLPANAWMAYGLQDVITLRQMMLTGEGEAHHQRNQQQKLEAMLALCEHDGCRRQRLLAWFGETLEQPCGNCDNCLQPPETIDATEAARKALSAVYRTGQRFGVTHLVQVLQGKADDRIRRLGHDRLSVYGMGTELDTPAWRALFRQLLARGLLRVDDDGYGTLQLTEACRPLLRGEARFSLRKPRKLGREKRLSAASDLPAEAERLFQALRKLRAELAREQQVPPYVIFGDRSLREMALHRPRDEQALLRIYGVGEQKLERYGAAFLACIHRHCDTPQGDDCPSTASTDNPGTVL